MPELRIILLVLGVLFVAGIAGFEWWRGRGQRPAAALASRGNARNDDRGNARNDDRGNVRTDDRESGTGESEMRELKQLPEINVVREPRVNVGEALPVIELASTSDTGTRRALGISISEEVAVDVSHDSASHPRTEPYIQDEVSEVRVVQEPQVEQPPPMVLAWPPEGERRIVTLRVIPRSEPRFPGRALRQAFSGCGFVHGPLDIYHVADPQGRVVLSAAALAQPGTFDPSIMDSQRFSGVNLFAVLPGPLPERETFEELVHAARQLAERLNGMIADQHGEELTAARITRLRQSLEAPPAAGVPGEA